MAKGVIDGKADSIQIKASGYRGIRLERKKHVGCGFGVNGVNEGGSRRFPSVLLEKGARKKEETLQ